MSEPNSVDTVATLVATFVSTLIASFVAWIVGDQANKSQEKRAVEDLIVKMIDISMEYPHVENDSFCSNWQNIDHTDDQAMRYDNYCCLVFNTLERLWRCCGRRGCCMEEMLHYEELMYRHRAWWNSEVDNRRGYPRQFQKLVDKTIAEAEQRSAENVA